MKIINPLYDKAFKYLMDNESIAKKILSVVIGQEIISLSSKPQETVVYIKGSKIPLSRYDFKAIILTKQGERYTTIIEVQKSRSPNPIPRFRRYLSKNYLTEHNYTDENGKDKREHLPIISIYFLGYKLGTGEYDTPAIIVDNSVINAITKKKIHKKHNFVKMLTHPCYILQVERLKPERKTRLEKMLSLFDQSYCTEDKYILEIDEIDTEFSELANYLSQPTLDEDFVRSLIYEEDYEKWRRNIEVELKETQKREKDANKSLKKIITTLLKSEKTISEIAIMIDKTENEINQILNS